MSATKVWDPFIRLFHWSLVLLFAANAFVIDDEASLHQWIGYAIISLVAMRIIWGFIGSRYARFSSFPPNVSASVEQLTDIATGRRTPHLGHTPLGGLMIYNLLFTLIMICASGYLMTTDMFWGVEWPEELHEAAFYWAEFSIVLHVAAVGFESVRTRVNLPKAMITGVKNI